MKITSFQRLAPDQVVYHRFTEEGGHIGRSSDCDWVLPDPDKVVSKKHAAITYNDGQFHLSDQSTNGVYVNNNAEPLGQGNLHTFEKGDNIRLGDYEILIERISQNNDPMPVDNITDIEDSRQSKENTKPAPSPVVKMSAAARETRTVAGNDAFSPPSMLLPDDWNITDLEAIDSHHPVEEKPQKVVPAAKTTKAVKFNLDQNTTKPTLTETTPAQSSDALEAFAKGLGIKEPEKLNSSIMQMMGESLRDTLAGMLDVMATRSAMKGEFRVMQTMIRSSENNPIKFSVDVDEVIQNLFLRDISGFLKPKEAISEAFKDLNTHEIALMTAVQAAMRSALQEISPESIKSKPYASLGIKKAWPGAQKAKYWQVFEHCYNDINKDILDGQNQYMDAEFAKAYEDKLQELDK